MSAANRIATFPRWQACAVHEGLIEATCVEGNFNYYNFDLQPLPQADNPDF